MFLSYLIEISLLWLLLEATGQNPKMHFKRLLHGVAPRTLKPLARKRPASRRWGQPRAGRSTPPGPGSSPLPVALGVQSKQPRAGQRLC